MKDKNTRIYKVFYWCHKKNNNETYTKKEAKCQHTSKLGLGCTVVTGHCWLGGIFAYIDCGAK